MQASRVHYQAHGTDTWTTLIFGLRKHDTFGMHGRMHGQSTAGTKAEGVDFFSKTRMLGRLSHHHP